MTIFRSFQASKLKYYQREQQLSRLSKIAKILTSVAVLILIIFIILYTNTDWFVNHAEEYRPTKALLKIQNYGIELMSTKTNLERRNLWAWFTSAGVGGMLVAATSLAGSYWVNACANTAAIATPVCWYAAAGICIVGGIGAALTTVAGANLGNERRSMTDETNVQNGVHRQGFWVDIILVNRQTS